MLVREAPRLQGRVQRLAFGAGAGLAAHARLQPIELGKLLPGIGRCVVGDIIRRAREAIEGEDRRAQLGAHEARGDRKILVPVPLAGGEVDGRCSRVARHGLDCGPSTGRRGRARSRPPTAR